MNRQTLYHNASGLSLALLLAAFLTACGTVNNIPEPTADAPDGAAAWSEILTSRVNAKGQIDFDTMRKDPAVIGAAAYHFATGDLDALANADEQMAFYLNGYNALAMYHAVTSKHLPKDTVRFFATSKLKFAGEEMSLHHLENKRIRPLDEPRIHFALNCMVRDCPRLLQVPFRAEVLNAQLDAVSREFLNDPRRVAYDAASTTVQLSPILKWYREDFESEDLTLLGYINTFRTEPIPEDTDIDWFEYDWTLNQSE